MSSSNAANTSLRRSTRSNAGRRKHTFHDSDLNPKWRRFYLDMGHIRLRKCTIAIKNASDLDIQQLHGKSFLATAISAASAYGASKEDLLLAYAHVVVERRLDPNDTCTRENSALVLACYHGYHKLAEYLLDLGCSLESEGMYGNAIEASVQNGQHKVLELLMEKRRHDAAALFSSDGCSWVLRQAVRRRDIQSVRILSSKRFIKPTFSDISMNVMRRRGQEKRHLWPMLRELYPNLPNVTGWNKQIHWSFPTSDRYAINLLWYSVGADGRMLPSEIWVYILSFVGRGWFAS